jgi:hypothetical protein
MKSHLRVQRVAVVCAAGAAAAFMAPLQAGAHESSIEGVWRVTRNGVNCQTGQVLSTFNAIMSFAHGGSETGFAVPPGTTPAMNSPEFGTWTREPGAGKYSFRFLANSFDVAGSFSGSTAVEGNVTVNPGGTTFSYTSTIQFLDVAGGLRFTACGAGSGTRY